jgi:outer membrane lipoprotein-sorting protein
MRCSLRAAATLAVIVCSLAGPSARAQSPAPTVDDIVAKNLQSKGGLEKIKATTTVKMTGIIRAQGKELPMTTWAKRPNLMRREARIDGQTNVVAFDGATFWMAAGTQPPQKQPAAALANRDSEFDSIFVDYKEKGTSVELVGQEPVDGKNAYHLKVTRKGGAPQDFYLDAATGLERKLAMSASQGAQTVSILGLPGGGRPHGAVCHAPAHKRPGSGDDDARQRRVQRAGGRGDVQDASGEVAASLSVESCRSRSSRVNGRTSSPSHSRVPGSAKNAARSAG